MTRTCRIPHVLWVFAVLCASLSGCSTVSPTMTPYPFILQDEKLAEFVPQVYDPRVVSANPSKVAACFTEPQGWTISFHGSLSRKISEDSEDCTLFFGPGVYPFELRPSEDDEQPLCGAMMVVNVDQVVALATFGKSLDTKLFPPDVIRKAREGVLAEYTITFDAEPVIKYWLGNRRKLYAGGRPTAELDFSRVQGLEKVRVDGSKAKDLVALVRAPKPRVRRAEQPVWPPLHRLEMEMADGTVYRGYVRDLKASAYTAFARLPCSIPSRLFYAADRGTIAKFTVFCGGLRREELAEIVFGRE